MNALEIRGLTKHFADFTLDDLNLTLPGAAFWGSSAKTARAKAPPSA